MSDASSSKGFNFVKFYFTVVSIVSVIGMMIAYALACYQFLRLVVISDKEWVTQRGWYELESCRTTGTDGYAPAKPIEDTATNTTPPTPEEIIACQQKVTERISSLRKSEAKDVIIGGLVRGTFFLFLFLTHYPRMIKLERQPLMTESKPIRTTRRSTKPTKKS